MQQSSLRNVSSQGSRVSLFSTATTLRPADDGASIWSAAPSQTSLMDRIRHSGHEQIQVTRLALMRAGLSRPKVMLSDAVRCGNVPKLEWLLSNNAKTKLLDDQSLNIALMRASGNGYIRVAEILIQYGANVNFSDEGGERPLHLAATFGHDDMCMLLVESGAEIEARNDGGSTPLAFAAAYSNTASVKRLLDLGASIDAPDDIGRTPLEFAARFKQRENMKLLIAEGATVAHGTEPESMTYCHSASSDNIIDEIIERVAVQGRQPQDKLPFSFAAFNGQIVKNLRTLQDIQE